MAYKPGDVVSNRYRILERLGAGAHGVVYRARDLETRGELALKFLGDGKGLDPELSRRMEREAMAMARLRGTSAVYVHGIATAQDGMLYVAMEMLYGKDFEQYLAEAEKVGGRIKAVRLLEILRPVAATLEQAHRQGIIHRDLKPSNVFIVDQDKGGGVRLLDFGLAKLLDATTLTNDGMIAGTPSYIAPEAWRGTSKHLDHRIDVYSLGVIVFRALAGKLPPPSSDLLEICKWATTGPRPSLHALRASLPAAIDPWIQRALAIFPEQRFQSVAEAFANLEAILAVRPTAPY
ncbi:MAG TPA: serine/threonine-protein kinase [Polyangiaceae bacterium]|nr:serine/threonine-protein kinase [Polyangiaceae bacterium]